MAPSDETRQNTDSKAQTIEQAAVVDTAPETTPRSLTALVTRIRRDASSDAAHYLMRSNTSHDGE